MKKIISRKTISLVLAFALVLAMSVEAFADTTIDPDSSPATGNTAVSYTNGAAYTVTIPASVTLDNSVTVKAEDVAIEDGYNLSVKLTATSGTDNAFTVACQDDTLAYTVKKDSTAVSIGDAVLTVTAGTTSGSQDLSFTLDDGETAAYAGTYTGTVTFTVSVDAQ